MRAGEATKGEARMDDGRERKDMRGIDKKDKTPY